MKFITKLISFLILLVVFACVVGVVVKFTDFGQDLQELFAPDTAFYVEFNGKRYDVSDEDTIPPSITLPRGKEVRFEVYSTQGYNVTVTPNVSEKGSYAYSVNGVSFRMTYETNLTKAFLSADNVQTDHFTLNAFDTLFLSEVMSKLYDGSNVQIENWDISYLLTVHSGDEQIRIAIR